VHVLEHEQHRPAPADARKQVAHDGVQAMPLRVGVGLGRRRQLADDRGQLRDQASELTAARTESRAQLLRLDGA
jgi:hypothetical protein